MLENDLPGLHTACLDDAELWVQCRGLIVMNEGAFNAEQKQYEGKGSPQVEVVHPLRSS